MATLTTTLTISSTDATSDTDFGLTVTDSLTTQHPSAGISRVAIAVAGGSETTLVASSVGNKYVYIKHTGYQSDGSTASTNEVCIELGGNTDLLRLAAGEWCFFTSKSSSTVEVLSSSSQTILVEYAYWTSA